MKLALPTHDRKRLVVIVLLAVILLWVYGAHILMPLARTVWRLRHEVQMMREQLRGTQQTISQEPQLRQQYRQASSRVEQLRTVLPKEEELPAVIERLSDLASQTGVKIQLVTPQRPIQPGGNSAAPRSAAIKSPALYHELPIDIDAAAGFHQLGAFLSRIELGDQPMQLRMLRISHNTKAVRRHLVKMTVVTYVTLLETKPVTDQPPSPTRERSS